MWPRYNNWVGVVGGLKLTNRVNLCSLAVTGVGYGYNSI